MNIELKQAAQQAVDAFHAFGDADDFANLFELTQKMRALRTAIQQAEAGAEAQQPATPEPIGEVSMMPGASGFTMVSFPADQVPVGTKIYTTPQPAQATQAEVTDEQIAACVKRASTYGLPFVGLLNPGGTPSDFSKRFTVEILALRPEPVVEPFVATYSSESIGGKQHYTGRVNKGPRGGFFASTASVEDAGLLADALNAYTHPAPSVPDDSKRLNYLQDRGVTIDLIAGVAAFYPMRFRVGGLHSSANIDVRAAIDAAMLAAK